MLRVERKANIYSFLVSCVCVTQILLLFVQLRWVIIIHLTVYSTNTSLCFDLCDDLLNKHHLFTRVIYSTNTLTHAFVVICVIYLNQTTNTPSFFLPVLFIRLTGIPIRKQPLRRYPFFASVPRRF